MPGVMAPFNLFKRPEKAQQGVQLARRGWFSHVLGLFQGTSITPELWDNLEELLITADTGVGTTSMLLDRLKERAKREGIKEPPALKDALKQEMLKVL